MKHSAVKRIPVLAAAILLAASSLALAKGPQGITWTRHNMSASAPVTNMYRATVEDEICIYCHTPHGGTLDGPLWNRTLPNGAAGTFQHYTSSTLTAAASNATRAVNTESLLCLSCHDGSIGVNRVINPSNDIGPGDGRIENVISGLNAAQIEYIFGNAGSRIGASNAADGTTNLTDDHPVSFSYYDAADGPGADPGLHPSATVLGMTEGPRFFGANGVGGNRVECSTCHDPHVDYGDALSGSPNSSDVNYTKYTPFLIMPNDGSALCLACHNK